MPPATAAAGPERQPRAQACADAPLCSGPQSLGPAAARTGKARPPAAPAGACPSGARPQCAPKCAPAAQVVTLPWPLARLPSSGAQQRRLLPRAPLAAGRPAGPARWRQIQAREARVGAQPAAGAVPEQQPAALRAQMPMPAAPARFTRRRLTSWLLPRPFPLPAPGPTSACNGHLAATHSPPRRGAQSLPHPTPLPRPPHSLHPLLPVF